MVARGESQAVAAIPQGWPATGHEAVAEGDRRRDAEPWRGIEGAGPVVLKSEAAAIGPRRGRAVADDQGPDTLLEVTTDMEKGAALRGEHPLVAVARRVRRTDGVEVHVEH